MTILLVRPRLIGDVILTTPIIRALRRRFPDARILYLVEALAAPVVLANPHVSETIVIHHRKGWRRVLEDVALAWRLRAKRIDVAIDLHGGSRSGWLTWASRAATRVGYDVSGRRWNYTRRIPRPRGYAPRHSVRNLWDLLAAFDSVFTEPPDPDRDRVEMPVTAEAHRRAAERLAALGIGGADRLIVMHVAAGNEFRQWPATSFAAVARALAADRADHRILVLGGRSDEDLVNGIVREIESQAGAEVAGVATAIDWPLDEIRALMDRAAVFVGGDSGPVHIAATSDVPIVAIYGPTMPVTWAPWRPSALPIAIVEGGPLPCRPCDQRVCEPGDFRCLRRIAPDSVLSATRRLLGLEMAS